MSYSWYKDLQILNERCMVYLSQSDYGNIMLCYSVIFFPYTILNWVFGSMEKITLYFAKFFRHFLLAEEPVARRCSIKMLFLETSQNSGKKQLCQTLVQVFSSEFCEISKNAFSYSAPLVAASVLRTFGWIRLDIFNHLVPSVH